jgi:hypothetical protein
MKKESLALIAGTVVALAGAGPVLAQNSATAAAR